MIVPACAGGVAGTILCCLLAAAAPGVAQEAAPQLDASSSTAGAEGSDTASKPTRVARLAFFAGAVTVERADNTGSDAPVVNMPLPEGTRVVTGDYGQVEVEFEDGSLLRVTPRSSVVLDSLTLDSGVAHTRLTVLSGLAYFELRKAEKYSYAVDAGGTTATPVENTTLRIKLDEPPAVFAVLAGVVRLTHGQDFHADVRAGETLRTDAKDESRYFLTPQVADESWDQWNADRDHAAADSADRRTSARNGFAGEQGYGWSDLDENGSWYDMPGQGQVWQPNVADDAFDPYGYGSWVFVNTGYVWASGYGWGWTPFRCGYWGNFAGLGWAWQPDSGCGSWGYRGPRGGQTIVFLGKRPAPNKGPIKVPVPGNPIAHPILTVRGPDGARPPVVHAGPVKLAGVTVNPLQPVGARAGNNARAGQALDRDFPVDGVTHQAIYGVIRQPLALGFTPAANTPPPTSREPGFRGNGLARPPAPGTINRAGAPAAAASGGPARVPQVGVAPVIQVRPPMQAPPPAVRPPAQSAPPPSRPAPSAAPAPQPVHSSPPPAPAPAPAPAAVSGPVVTKGK